MPRAIPASVSKALRTWAGKSVIWFVLSSSAASAVLHLLQPTFSAASLWRLLGPLLLVIGLVALVLQLLAAHLAARGDDVAPGPDSTWGSDL